MAIPISIHAQPPVRMVAGALAHLARHMETGCPRAAHLAVMLLERIANDADADGHLRRHARELVDILDRDDDLARGTRRDAAVTADVRGAACAGIAEEAA